MAWARPIEPSREPCVCPCMAAVLTRCSAHATLGDPKRRSISTVKPILHGLLALLAASAAQAGPRDNSLNWASDSMPANVLPYGNDVREGVVLAFFVWDAPTYRDPKTGEYKPHLADSVKLLDPTTI